MAMIGGAYVPDQILSRLGFYPQFGSLSPVQGTPPENQQVQSAALDQLKATYPAFGEPSVTGEIAASRLPGNIAAQAGGWSPDEYQQYMATGTLPSRLVGQPITQAMPNGMPVWSPGGSAGGRFWYNGGAIDPNYMQHQLMGGRGVSFMSDSRSETSLVPGAGPGGMWTRPASFGLAYLMYPGQISGMQQYSSDVT